MLQDNLKKAFTIKELLFVVLMLIIFAVFIQPTLENTGGEIESSNDASNLKKCLQDIENSFLISGVENINTNACDNILCFGIDLGNNLHDGKITVFRKSDAEAYCYDAGGAFDSAEEDGLIGVGEDNKTYIFNSKRAKSWD
jgi:hypothetical protein